MSDAETIRTALCRGATHADKTKAWPALDRLSELAALHDTDSEELRKQVVTLERNLRDTQLRLEKAQLLHTNAARKLTNVKQQSARQVRQARYTPTPKPKAPVKAVPKEAYSEDPDSRARAQRAETRAYRAERTVAVARKVIEFVSQKNIWFVVFDDLAQALKEHDEAAHKTPAMRREAAQALMHEALSHLNAKMSKANDSRQYGLNCAWWLLHYLDEGLIPSRAAAKVWLSGQKDKAHKPTARGAPNG